MKISCPYKKVLIDEKLFHEILLNIAQNALYAITHKFEPNAVTENPEIKNKDFRGKFIISTFIKDNRYIFQFSDNGCGIDQEDLVTAFLPHATSKIKSEKDNCNIILYFPFISMGKTVENTRRALESICNNYLGSLIDGFLCQNAGDFALISKYDTAVCCDYSFNITNLHSFNELNALGVSRATISVEAQTLPKLGESGKIITPEIIIGGPIVLMRSRHCYIDEGECNGKCAKCTKAEYSLKDSMGCTFPILSQQSDCCSILLSHKPVSYTPSQVKKIRSENSKVTLRVNIL